MPRILPPGAAAGPGPPGAAHVCTGLQGAGPDPHRAPGPAASTSGLPGRCLQWTRRSPSQALFRAGLGAPETAGCSQDRPAGEEVLPGLGEQLELLEAAWARRRACTPHDAMPRTLELPRVLSRLCHPAPAGAPLAPRLQTLPQPLSSPPAPLCWCLPCSPLSTVTHISISPQPMPSPLLGLHCPRAPFPLSWA